MSETNYIPKYEFRIFGQTFPETERLIIDKATFIKEQTMEDVYLLTAADNENNVKIRYGKMDMKVLEETINGLELWSPYMIGDFPLKMETIKSTVFPALGISAPVLSRNEYTLNQFLEELVLVDPDLFIAHTFKKRKEFIFNGCEVEITDVTINSASIRTVCIESKDADKVLETKNILQVAVGTDNINYPTALKRIMGLIKQPGLWQDTV